MKTEGKRQKADLRRARSAGVILHPSSFILRALAIGAVLAAALTGCGGGVNDPIEAVPGNPQAGRAALERYQCGACHSIPGVAGANGLVGPPLAEYRQRVYIAGKFPKEPALLAKWIQDAPALAPQTAMPNVGVTEGDARDIAAYLYQLR